MRSIFSFVLFIGWIRPDHTELYEGAYVLDGLQWLNTMDDGVSPIFRGEQEPPSPRAIDIQADAELANDRLPTLTERIRAAIFDENQVEIEGTAQELSERFGYLEPSQFGRDVGLIEDNLMEFGIEIKRTRTPKKRHIRVYENTESPYHPIRQAHLT